MANGLVYVAAFAPEVGETAAELSGKFPGSSLGPTLAKPVALSEGGSDLYIQQDKFRHQFAADVPADQVIRQDPAPGSIEQGGAVAVALADSALAARRPINPNTHENEKAKRSSTPKAARNATRFVW